MRPPGDFPSQSMPPPSTHYQLSPPRAPPHQPQAPNPARVSSCYSGRFPTLPVWVGVLSSLACLRTSCSFYSGPHRDWALSRGILEKQGLILITL